MPHPQPKAATRAQILKAMQKAGVPLTALQIATRTRLAASTVKSHLSELRRDGEVELDEDRKWYSVS